MKSARRRARELAAQGLYQWLVSGASADEIVAHTSQLHGFSRADSQHFEALLRGPIRKVTELSGQLQPCLDRPITDLSPMEHAILLLAMFELTHHSEVPYRVVINEAVEIAKTFGGTDGYKYVNGVLDKAAGQIRAAEASTRA
jgi:N utilization substance protein B